SGIALRCVILNPPHDLRSMEYVAVGGHSRLQRKSYIEKCVASLEAVLKDTVCDFEIIVVNDGSRDKTAAVLESLQRSRPYLVAVHHERNQGLGRALRSGFERCRN